MSIERKIHKIFKFFLQYPTTNAFSRTQSKFPDTLSSLCHYPQNVLAKLVMMMDLKVDSMSFCINFVPRSSAVETYKGIHADVNIFAHLKPVRHILTPGN